MSQQRKKDVERKSPIITGKTLDRYFKLQDALLEFNKLFNYDEPDDRSIALVGSIFLETLLEHILWAFLVDDANEVEKLLKYDQPLGTFSGKITMTYCLGLIYRPVRNDLHLARKIRNEFAHNLYATFEDERIRSWCSALEWHKIAYVAHPPSDATARELFQVGINQLVSYLDGVVGIARMEKREVSKHY